MSAPWLGACVAFAVAVCLTPLIRAFCSHFHIYDPPGPLKIHTRPIARLGGIAIAAAALLGTAAAHLSFPPAPLPRWLSLLAAFLAVGGAGLLDDLRSIHPLFRLFAQFIAGALLAIGGWGVSLFPGTALNAIFTCLLVIFFINAFNFLDGADGIAAGVTALIALGYVALPRGTLPTLDNAIAFSLFGGCLAFLLFNFPPAKIFMGDSGSSLLGFLVALLALDFLSVHASEANKALLLFPFFTAALPLLDALLAVYRRLRQRTSPLAGDRRHFYDLLLARGWPPRKVVLACYGITAGLVILGWVSLRLEFPAALALAGLVAAGLIAVGVRLGSLGVQGGSLERSQPGAVRTHENALHLNQRS